MHRPPQDREARRLARRVGRDLRVTVWCERAQERVLVLTARTSQKMRVAQAIARAGYQGLLFYDDRSIFGCYKKVAEVT